MRFKILILLLFLAVSCSPAEDDILDVAMAQEPQTLDVMVNSSLAGRMIAVGNIYEKLLTLSPEGEIIPELAKSYQLSDDGTVLSFALRDGVRFHDGSELDAGDAAASLNRWLDKYQAAGAIAGESRFEIAGDGIAIKGKGSLALLPQMIASSPQSAVIIPEEYAMEDSLPPDVPGNGPYRLKQWRYAESMELEAFAGYAPYAIDKTPAIRHIIYRFVPDSVTRRLGLEAGIYDVIDMVSSDDIPALMENEGIQLLQGGDSGSIAVLFNKKAGICCDADFRRAVSLAADRDTLMAACYGGYGYNLDTSYMETDQKEWAVSGTDPFGKEDEEAAKACLSRSGYDGSPVRILSSNLSNLDKIALALASELEAFGVETEVTVLDWASFIERRMEPDCWDISVSAFTKVALPVQKSYLSPAFPGWTETDLLEPLYAASSPEEAYRLWDDIQDELWEAVPAMILGHYSTVFAADSGLKGIMIGEGLYFWNATF